MTLRLSAVFCLWLFGLFKGVAADVSPPAGQLLPEYRPRFEAPGEPYRLHPTPDGGMLIELYPDSVNIHGWEVRRLARLLEDGAIDESFAGPAFLTNASFRKVVPLPDRSVLVYHSGIWPNEQAGITRLKPDGRRDEEFQSHVFQSRASWHLLAVQPDGRLLVALDSAVPHYGAFPHLMRLLPDGRPDLTFSAQVNDGRAFRGAYLLADQRIVLEYSPRDPGTLSHRGSLWTRLLPDGSVDPSYHPPRDPNLARHDVSAVAPDGAILIAGYETSPDTSQWTYPFVRLRPDGSLDEEFRPSIRPRLIVGFLPGGNWLAVDSAPDQIAESRVEVALLELNPQGERENETHFATLEPIVTLGFDLLPDGNLLMQTGQRGGIYSRSGVLLENVAFSVSRAVTPPPPVAFPDGALLFGHGSSRPRDYTVAGGFYTSGPALFAAAGQIDRLVTLALRDHVAWHPFQLPDGRIVSVDTQSGLLVELERNGSTRPLGTTRWLNSSGSMQSDFSTITVGDYVAKRSAESSWDGRPLATASGDQGLRGASVLRDDRVAVWGSFTALAGWRTPGVARLTANLEPDRSFRSGLPQGSTVWHALAQPDGRILAALELASTNHLLCRLNADGTPDNSFHGEARFDGRIRALKLDGQGRILVGGAFRQAAGRSMASVARLNHDGTLDESFVRGEGASHAVEQLYPLPDDSVVAHGDFRRFDGEEAWGLVRLSGGPPAQGPPRILTITAAGEIREGRRFALGVVLAGETPRHGQWHYNGLALPGETNESLLLPNPGLEEAGTYTFTCGNRFGLASAGTHLEVVPPLPEPTVLTSVPPSNGSDRWLGLALAGTPGQRHRLQVSTNLAAWQNLDVAVPANSIVRFAEPFAGGNVLRFFRAVPVPAQP